MARPVVVAKDATGQEAGSDNAKWGNIAADQLRSIVERCTQSREATQAAKTAAVRIAELEEQLARLE
jgi:hypothetical protein